jgi:hypothetical protein
MTCGISHGSGHRQCDARKLGLSHLHSRHRRLEQSSSSESIDTPPHAFLGNQIVFFRDDQTGEKVCCTAARKAHAANRIEDVKDQVWVIIRSLYKQMFSRSIQTSKFPFYSFYLSTSSPSSRTLPASHSKRTTHSPLMLNEPSRFDTHATSSHLHQHSTNSIHSKGRGKRATYKPFFPPFFASLSLFA